MKKILSCLMVVGLLVGVVAADTATATQEPAFEIIHGNMAQLNMSLAQITQVGDDDPTDLVYYIGAPLNITVKNETGFAIQDATVIIKKGALTYANLITDQNGMVNYTFNETQITQFEEQVAIRASKLPEYPFVEKLIWIVYEGILNVEQGNTEVDVVAVSQTGGGNEMRVYFTSVVVDVANVSTPEAGVNVTEVVVNTVNIRTGANDLYWLPDGPGSSALNPKSLITDENGEATFGVHVVQDQEGDVDIGVLMNATKEAYMPANSSSSISVDANSKCFIATAAYGSPLNENLDTLRAFRDTILLTNSPGKVLVETYYATSPPIANALSQSDGLRAAIRISLLAPLVYFSALCLNIRALVAVIVLILLILIVLKPHAAVLFNGIEYGALIIVAFTITVFILGAFGYETPVYAAIGAYLLPLIIPVAVCVCVCKWMGKNHRNFTSGTAQDATDAGGGVKIENG